MLLWKDFVPRFVNDVLQSLIQRQLLKVRYVFDFIVGFCQHNDWLPFSFIHAIKYRISDKRLQGLRRKFVVVEDKAAIAHFIFIDDRRAH